MHTVFRNKQEKYNMTYHVIIGGFIDVYIWKFCLGLVPAVNINCISKQIMQKANLFVISMEYRAIEMDETVITNRY